MQLNKIAWFLSGAGMLALAIPSAPALAECLAVLGDVNGNGSADVVDLQCSLITIAWSTGGEVGAPPACSAGAIEAVDANCDESLTVSDAQIIVGQLLGSALPAAIDIDANGCIDACQPSVCGDGFCDGGETGTCAADCAAEAGDSTCCATLPGSGPSLCGDSSCTSCVCALDPYCCTTGWDSFCAQCASGGAGFNGACLNSGCAAACGCVPLPPCGDGFCSNILGEDPMSCPADCGGGPVCGDGACMPGEDFLSCPADCEEPPPPTLSCAAALDCALACPPANPLPCIQACIGQMAPAEQGTAISLLNCATAAGCVALVGQPGLMTCIESNCGPQLAACMGPPPCGDGFCDEAAGETFDTCPADCPMPFICPGDGACDEANGSPGCDDEACCNIVCDLDPFCCDVQWDGICAGEAIDMCDGYGPVCGDGMCMPGEDFLSCPDDCEEPPPPTLSCAEALDCSLACPPADPLPCVEACIGQMAPAEQGTAINLLNCATAAGCVALAGQPGLMTCIETNCGAELNMCSSGIACGDGACQPPFEDLTSCPQDCQPHAACPGLGPCGGVHDGVGCDDVDCCNIVCAVDPFCCDIHWDGLCATEGVNFCGATGICGDFACTPDESLDTCPEDCQEPPNPCGDGFCDAFAGEPLFCPADCLDLSTCCLAPLPGIPLTPGCGDAACESCVCDISAFCCDVAWDMPCAEIATYACPDCGCLPAPECGNGVCEPGEGCQECSTDCGPCPPNFCCAPSPIGSTGCELPTCESCVCAQQPSCCDTFWDEQCSFLAAEPACADACGCMPNPVCGDGMCQPGEGCNEAFSCADDCGGCTCIDTANCLLACGPGSAGGPCADACIAAGHPTGVGIALDLVGCLEANHCLDFPDDPQAFNACLNQHCSALLAMCIEDTLPQASCGDGVCEFSEQCGQVNQCQADCNVTCTCIDTTNCMLQCGPVVSCADQCAAHTDPMTGATAQTFLACIYASPCLGLPDPQQFSDCVFSECMAEAMQCAELPVGP